MVNNNELFDIDFTAAQGNESIQPATLPTNNTNRVNSVYDIDFSTTHIELDVIPSHTVKTVNIQAITETSTRVSPFDIQKISQKMIALAESPPPKDTREIPEVSPELLVIAENAITQALQMTTSPVIMLNQLVKLAYGQDVMPTGRQKWELKQALKQTQGIEYLQHGQFGFAERLTPDTYWAGNIESNISIEALTQSTLRAMADMKRRVFSTRTIMGIVESQGYSPNENEYADLMASLYGSPALRIDTDGDVYFDNIPPVISKDVVEEPLIKPLKKEHKTRREINNTLYEIKKTPEYRQAKEIAKNIANPRKRKHKPKSSNVHQSNAARGKSHGKKQIISQTMSSIRKTAS